MHSIADQLPPDIAQQLHPDRRKNEAEYWAARDQLLGQYRGQWVGFADGKVIASGSSPVAVFHKAEATGQHPFFVCVGHEEQPCRIRRLAYSYDTNYPGEALPAMPVEFRQTSGAADGQEYPCRLQADFLGSDRILGRDVLNCLEILFRGPAREVIVNP